MRAEHRPRPMLNAIRDAPLSATRRRWASGRLAHRFTLVSAALSVALSLLVGGALYYVSSQGLLDQRRDNIQANAMLVARQTEGLLATLAGTIDKLANNSVLATGLVDSAGRETYILPFLQSFQQIAGVPISLVFTDFEGKPIANNGLSSVSADDMAWLVRTILTGQRSAVIIEERGRPYLLAVEMLVYSRTASPEGALLYKAPLDALVLDPHAHLLHSGRSAFPPTGNDFIVVNRPLKVPPVLEPLGLSLYLEAPVASAATPLSWVLPAYVLVGVIGLAAVMLGSRAAGYYLTRSLHELEQLAEVIVRDGFTVQRARIHGDDEVTGLARGFNAMLDHIAAIQRERELRAAEEIAIQRTLAERAEQARAEAEAATEEAEYAHQKAMMALMAAESANEMKTRFLAAASHDLRQPVQSLVLMTDLLASRLLDHPAAEFVKVLEVSVDALCRLLEALLDVSRLDAGTVPINPQAVQLSKIFQGLEAEYQMRAVDKGLTLRTVPSSLMLHTDPALLERIIRNLLENALRYTDQGRILLGCRRRGDKVLIQIHDTGAGIPAEHLEHIFQEFYQVSNPARDRSKGLGLGLAIVDRLARLLDYRVSVSSRFGKGTCFTVEAALSSDVAEEPASAKIVVEPSRPGSAGFAVVIDDDFLVREGLKVMIEQSGWCVLSADNATSALRQLASCPERPTLVIADYRLEGGATGIEALRSIEAQVGEPVLSVVLTGDTAPERIAEVQASGYRILHKPLPTQELRALLAEVSGLAIKAPDESVRMA